MALTPNAPNNVWQMPPSMMPAVAASPRNRPAVSELAMTKNMSMPGTMMMPNSSTE